MSKAVKWRDRDLHSIEDVRTYVDSVIEDLAIEPVAIEVVPRRQPGVPISRADADPISRTIYVEEPDERGAMSRALALHELAHILVPPDQAHGPLFVRVFTDLLDRYHPDLSSDIRVQYQRYGVDLAAAHSRWAKPNSFLNQRELEALEDEKAELTKMLVALNQAFDP